MVKLTLVPAEQSLAANGQCRIDSAVVQMEDSRHGEGDCIVWLGRRWIVKKVTRVRETK